MATATAYRTVFKLSDVQVKGIFGRLENIAQWAQEPTPELLFCSDKEIREQIAYAFPQQIGGHPARVAVSFGDFPGWVSVSCKIRISENHRGTPLTKRRIVPAQNLSGAVMQADFIPKSSFAYHMWCNRVVNDIIPGVKMLGDNHTCTVTGTVDDKKPGYPVNLDLVVTKHIALGSVHGARNLTRADVYKLVRLVVANMLVQG